jgi:hypothetical protein
MEELSKEGEFTDIFRVVTLPKNTDFYNQLNDYAEPDSAKEFRAACTAQVMSGTDCGFYFPSGMMSEKIVQDLVSFVHEQFFNGKSTYNRKERLDFIEIFYFFLVLRILDSEKADVISFSCKDGVDTGAAMAASFYGFARMVSTAKPWTEEDKNFFLFAFFGPALLIRNRSIAPHMFQRTISALDHFETVLKDRRDPVLRACAQLFPDLPLGDLRITEVA